MGTSEGGTLDAVCNRFLSAHHSTDDAAGTGLGSNAIQPPSYFSQDSNDSRTGTVVPNGHIEERVQVDRRKLEQMIVAGRDVAYPHHDRNQFEAGSVGFSTAAETFFTNVMRNTSTVITWPTKLKVGAKTKKDPFVKIVGRLEDVERAKKLILASLETRHNRVTIKIDVAFTDHSHIIGKHGRNTQLAMKQTACHIHFPDSNRNPDLEKSNMVSIAGPMQTVDQARRMLRELAPLVITLETKTIYDDPSTLADDPLVRELSSTTGGISVLVRSNRTSGCPVFMIRGSVFQAARIRTAVLSLQQRFMNTTQAPCSTTLEILQQQHPFVLGPQNSNIQLISQRTGAAIQYPRGDAASTTFLIQGSIDAVLNARKHLVGCLPMSFVFESQNEAPTSAQFVAELEKQYGLSISLRPKRNGDTRNIVLKGQERQATAMYDLRRHFINADEPRVVAVDFEFMRDFDPNALMHVSPTKDIIANAAASLSLIQSQTVISPLVVNSSVISPIQSPPVFGYPSLYSASPFSPLPAAPISSPVVPDIGPSAYYNSRDCIQAFGVVAPIQSTAFYSESTNNSSRSSPSDNQTPSLGSSTISGSTVTRTPSASVLNSNDPVPEEAPLACGLLEAAKKIQENSNNWKAPGAERSSANVDYDQQMLMATKAMQEKPLGLRVPNQQWAGLGFSRSMPAPVLRQLKVVNAEKSIDFGESSGSSSSSGALQALEEDEEDKIGPWPLETRRAGQLMKEGAFTMTTYFDSVHLPRPSNNVRLADIDDMPTLLSHLHLTKYLDTFREQEVDMNAFLTMNDADLKELGVNTFGARRKLLVAISEIKEYRRHFH